VDIRPSPKTGVLVSTLSKGRHLFDIVAKYVEATFDFVERIVRLVVFDNVASALLLVWTGLYGKKDLRKGCCCCLHFLFPALILLKGFPAWQTGGIKILDYSHVHCGSFSQTRQSISLLPAKYHDIVAMMGY